MIKAPETLYDGSSILEKFRVSLCPCSQDGFPTPVVDPNDSGDRSQEHSKAESELQM